MKIILLQDVAKIGRRHEVVDVPDGYALNQLIPRRMAQPATADNLKRIQKLQKDKAVSVQAGADAFAVATKILTETTMKVTAQANEQGHLFKAVSQKEISEAAKVLGATISPDSVVLATPIKELGAHTVVLKHGADTATVSLEVVNK